MHSISGACAANAITCRGRRDGFGAQFAAMVSVYSWAKWHSVPFCSSRWQAMEHGANASELFDFVGGEHYGPPATATTQAVTDKHMQLGARGGTAAWRRRNLTAWPRAWERSDVARHYAAGPKPALRHFVAGRRAVVMHVRRGDVSWRRLPGRFTTNGRLALCALNVLRALPSPRRGVYDENILAHSAFTCTATHISL